MIQCCLTITYTHVRLPCVVVSIRQSVMNKKERKILEKKKKK